MLQSRRRRRHGAYPLAAPSPLLKSAGWAAVVLLLILIGGWMLYRAFAPGGMGRRVATVLQAEGLGGVHVRISGEREEQRAQSGLRLYDRDQVRTDVGAVALLQFFDGSLLVLDGGTVVRLEEVIVGDEASSLSVSVERGQVWVETGTGMQITRLLATPLLHHTLPPRTRAIFRIAPVQGGREEISVFDTSGPGVEVALRDSGRVPVIVIVGEGQQFTVTSQAVAQLRDGRLSPYDLREVLSEQIVTSVFYQQNIRRKAAPAAPAPPPRGEVAGEQLTVDTPADGALLQGDTVRVQGRVGARVVRVLVNGYGADIVDGMFGKEIALPGSESFVIEVQAEDREGLIVAQKTLTVTRDIRPPDPPRITAPGGSGDTVLLSDDTFEIMGEASSDTTGIIVNGYQLQKFVPGKPWRYLVDPAIGNVKVGENIYEIIALDRSGNRSAPVHITILWKAEPLPLVHEKEEVTRDRREYIAPGSLRILAPTSGSPYQSNAEEVLIEGETFPETAVISVNGFTLTKYVAGKTTWNYYASERFGNYRLGKNLFTIVARNAAGQILDVLRYTIERQ